MNRRTNSFNIFGSLALSYIAPFALGFAGFPFAAAVFTAALSLKWTHWMHEPSRLQELHLLETQDTSGRRMDALGSGLVNDIFGFFGIGSALFLVGNLSAHLVYMQG